jgi:hypothetical protein
MNTQLKPDELTDPTDFGIRGDSLQRLIVDIEDLVDWAADLAPQVVPARDASRAPYLVALGLAALTAAAITLLVIRRDR